MWPDYIPTRPVDFGGAFTLEGGRPTAFDLEVEASRSLIWAATGAHFESFATVERVAYAADASFVLPVGDAEGWRDAATGSVIDVSAPDTFTHSYTATVRMLDAAGRVLTSRTFPQFVLPSGSEPVSILSLLVADVEEGELVPVGPEGPEGPEGPAATVSVGSVTTVESGQPATVTNSGDEHAAVLEFAIPQGQPGGKGDPGDNGAPGVVQELVAGDNVAIDSADPARPVISSTGAVTDADVAGMISDPASDVRVSLADATAQLVDSDTVARHGVVSVAQDVRLGGAVLSSPLARLREGIAQPALRTRVVVAGDSYAASYKATPGCGVADRLAFAANSPSFDRVEDAGTPPASGMIWFQAAQSATDTTDYLPADRRAAIITQDPDYLIHMIGANDWGRGITPEAYKENLLAAIDAIDAGTTATVHILVHQPPRHDVSGPHPWAEYGTAMQEIADAAPGTRVYVDVLDYMDVYDMAHDSNAWALVGSDGVHMTDAGHRVLADVLGTLLGIPQPTGIGPNWVAAPFNGVDSYYTERTDIATLSIPAAAYPRLITVDYTMAARRTTSSGTTTVAVGIRQGETVRERHARTITNESPPIGYPVSFRHVLPPGITASVVAEASPSGSDNELAVVGSSTYTWGSVTVEPY